MIMICCWKCVRACGTVLLIGLLSGCGGGDGAPGRAIVSGTVALDGQPLPGADVVFEPEDGGISMGSTDESGEYVLRYSVDEPEGGLPAGRYTVRITTGDRSGRRRVRKRVPAKYNQLSELIEEVKPGENTINFDLESEGVSSNPTRPKT